MGCSDMQFYTELLQAGTHKTLIRHMKNAEKVCNQKVGTYTVKAHAVVLHVKNNLSHMQWVTLHIGSGTGGEGGHLGYVPSLKRILRIMPSPPSDSHKLLLLFLFFTRCSNLE